MAPSLRTIIAKLKKAHNEGGIRKKAWAKLKGLVGKSKKLPQSTIANIKKHANSYQAKSVDYAKLRGIFGILASLTKELESTQDDPKKMDEILEKRKTKLTSQVGIDELKFDKKEKCSDKTIQSMLKAIDMNSLSELEKQLTDSKNTCDMLSKICDDLNDFYETLANSGRQNSELYENIKGHERTLHSAEDTYFRGNDEKYTTDLGSLAKKVISFLYSADPSQSRIPHVFIVQPIPRIETILKI